jgi:hypothetical protein
MLSLFGVMFLIHKVSTVQAVLCWKLPLTWHLSIFYTAKPISFLSSQLFKLTRKSLSRKKFSDLPRGAHTDYCRLRLFTTYFWNHRWHLISTMRTGTVYIVLKFHCNIMLSPTPMLPMSPLLIRFLARLFCVLVSNLRVTFRTYPNDLVAVKY